MKNAESQQTVESDIVQHPLIIPEKAPLDVMNLILPASLEKFFVYPFGQSGHALEGLFHRAAQIMRTKGVAEENVRAGLIILSVISSIQLEMPFSIILRVHENVATAEHLLNTCIQFAYRSSIIELQRLRPDDLYSSGDLFKNKVLICRELSGLKKVEPDLKSLIVNGRATIQAPSKSRYSTMMTNHEITGPVAFIGIEREDEQRLFDHPAIMRIPVTDFGEACQCDDETDLQELSIERRMDQMAEYISRFGWRRVSIPYAPEISSVMRRQRPVNYIQINGFIRNLIAAFTIMNHPETINVESLMARLIPRRTDRNQDDVRSTVAHTRSIAPTDGELTTGKVEYFILKKLLEGMISVNIQSTSPLRKQLFEIVKQINFTNLQSSALTDDLLEKLYTLTTTDQYWARIEHVFKRLNRSRTDIISIPVIEAELAALKKMGVIERKKFRDRDDYGYYILTLAVDEELKFPDIQHLYGECPDGELIEAMDPITGIVEKI